MGFVRSEEEVERLKQALSRCEFNRGRSVKIRHEVDSGFVEHILPPGLEPTGDSDIEIGFVDVRQSVCGAYTGSNIYVGAEREGVSGKYPVALYMSTDASIAFGRELFGEPKKQGVISVDRRDQRIEASVRRYGETIIDAVVNLTTEGQAAEESKTIFTYKYLPAIDGNGFHAGPSLAAIDVDTSIWRPESGTGSVAFGGGSDDGLNEIPVGGPIDAEFANFELTTSNHRILTEVDPDEFLPYAYGTNRNHDWLPLSESTIGTGYDASARHAGASVTGWTGFQ